MTLRVYSQLLVKLYSDIVRKQIRCLLGTQINHIAGKPIGLTLEQVVHYTALNQK